MAASIPYQEEVGLDLAKQVFQVHAIERDGRVIVPRALPRKEVLEFFRGLPAHCLVGLEVRFDRFLNARAGQAWP